MVRLKERIATLLSRSYIGFQFLMVRLKGCFVFIIFIFLKHISIPYGAIKSNTKNMKKVTVKLFQFLMVRLKA